MDGRMEWWMDRWRSWDRAPYLSLYYTDQNSLFSCGGSGLDWAGPTQHLFGAFLSPCACTVCFNVQSHSSLTPFFFQPSLYSCPCLCPCLCPCPCPCLFLCPVPCLSPSPGRGPCAGSGPALCCGCDSSGDCGFLVGCGCHSYCETFGGENETWKKIWQEITIAAHKLLIIWHTNVNQSIKFYLYSPYSQTTVRLMGL